MNGVPAVIRTNGPGSAGLEEAAIDQGSVSNLNCTVKEFGCFRANGRVKTAASDIEDLKPRSRHRQHAGGSTEPTIGRPLHKSTLGARFWAGSPFLQPRQDS